MAYRTFPDWTVLKQPVFIVGCGRSGTTVLGELLGQHRRLAYLNEPRHIWFIEPRTDVWTERARERKGAIRLTARDVKPAVAAQIRREFAVAVRLNHGTRLVEKLPINSFRIDFINQIFPDAMYIHLIRNGIEVARSIASLAGRNEWQGHDGYRWQLLAALAREHGDEQLVELCHDHFHRGLLEWRLSVTAAREALDAIPQNRRLEIRYKGLLRQPLTTCTLLEDFIGVEPSEEMRQFAKDRIARRSPPADTGALTPAGRYIAGDLLAELGYLNPSVC